MHIYHVVDSDDVIHYSLQKFNCNGTVVENPEYGEVIQLQGDQRDNIRTFLQAIKLAKPEQLHVHGF